MQRLFVALDMPPAENDSLSGLCQGVSGAKWAVNAPFHLTLRFIGDADEGLLRDILFALAEIDAPAFDLALKGVGYFPPRGPAKILWAGVDAAPGLVRLREQVTAAQVRDFIARHALFKSAASAVTQFHLYSSLLRPEGALHRIEASYPLLGGEADWQLEAESL